MGDPCMPGARRNQRRTVLQTDESGELCNGD